MYSVQKMEEALRFVKRCIPEFRIILTKRIEYCFKEYQLVCLSTGDGLRAS